MSAGSSREIDPFTIRKGDLIRWEHEDEVKQFRAKFDQPPYKAWGTYYLVKPDTIAIPSAALNGLRERISAWDYDHDDEWGVIDFLNEVDEYLGGRA